MFPAKSVLTMPPVPNVGSRLLVVVCAQLTSAVLIRTMIAATTLCMFFISCSKFQSAVLQEQVDHVVQPALIESVNLSEDIEYGSPAGSGESRRDGDRVLTSAQLSRQGCDREGRRILSSRDRYRSRYSGFSRVTAG